MLIEKGLDESINEKTEDAINAHFIEVCPFVGMVDHVFEVYNGVFLTMQEDRKGRVPRVKLNCSETKNVRLTGRRLMTRVILFFYFCTLTKIFASSCAFSFLTLNFYIKFHSNSKKDSSMEIYIRTLRRYFVYCRLTALRLILPLSLIKEC